MKTTLVLIFLFVVQFLFAQRNLVGVVTDKNNNPVSGVSILVVDAEVKTLTDSFGRYTLSVPLGFNVLLFSKPGLKFQTIEITRDTIDLEMMSLTDVRIALEELMQKEVEVASGSNEALINAPANVLIVSSEDIRNRGYSSLAEVLTDLPGFDVMITNGVEYSTAYQRGYRTPFFQRTLLLINGKVDNNIYSQTANVSRQFPMTSIERIEVLYGPASVVYGANAFLGVINVITKDGAELVGDGTKFEASSQYGSFNTRAFEVSGVGKRGDFSFSLSARLFNSDEADLSDKWGYLSNSLYSNKDIWGPLLMQENSSRKMDHYYDPSRDMSMIADIKYKTMKMGFVKYYVNEAYGPTYPADRVQNNAFWNRDAMSVCLDNEARIANDLVFKTSLTYRKSGWGGDWAEATPDWNAGMERYSYISRTSWTTYSDSWLGQQIVDYTLNSKVKFSGGLKFEQVSTTKNYDIPGYWIPTYGSTIFQPTDTGAYGYGLAIGHSTDSLYYTPPANANALTPTNMAHIFNYGGFVLSMIELYKIQLNLGLRYDKNSIYGETVNPRLAAIYKLGKKGAVKLLYGEAFQEPSPIMLWGGWQGREMNSNLKPEKVRNTELVGVYNTGILLNEVSVYYAHYDNVIKEDAENAGARDVCGIEYRLRIQIDNFIPNSKSISGYAYYTYTYEQSDTYFNHTTGQWERLPANYTPQKGEDDLRSIGDIAPHKVQFGVNLPIRKFNVNLQGNWVSQRNLYSRNPLRVRGYTLDPYLLLNANVGYFSKKWALSLKINNLLNANYLLPGVQAANAGDDFSNRSLGFYNSITPTVGINYLINLTLKI